MGEVEKSGGGRGQGEGILEKEEEGRKGRERGGEMSDQWGRGILFIRWGFVNFFFLRGEEGG